MDWPTLEVILFSWKHFLDILWCWDRLFAEGDTFYYVPFVSSDRDSKCSNDGMEQFPMLSICITFYAITQIILLEI